MKTYLITGGAGFIGSHLAEALIAGGHRVLALDDLSTGSRENIAALEGHPRFELTVDTVLSEARVEELVARADAVFHLAAAVGVRLVVDEPVRTIDTNVRGTAVVLESASKRGRPVLLTSSSEVYGKSERLPFREDDDIVLGTTSRSRWAYGCSKALDEFLVLAHVREHGLPAVVARLFNTTGPRQTGRYGMVVPRFVRQALAGEPLTVYGDGTQQRCFCHVAEVVEALIRLIDHPRARGGVFNVGSDEEISIRELAERVRTLAGSRSDIVLVPYADAWDKEFEDMTRRIPDLTRVRDLIGHRPPRTLDEIIADVIEHERGRASTAPAASPGGRSAAR